MNELIKPVILITIFLLPFVNDFAQDRQKHDSLWNEYNKAKHDTTRIQLLLDIGDVYEHENPDSALYFYQKAFELADKASKSPASSTTHTTSLERRTSCISDNTFALLKATSLSYIGIVHYYRGDYDKALNFFLNLL